MQAWLCLLMSPLCVPSASSLAPLAIMIPWLGSCAHCKLKPFVRYIDLSVGLSRRNAAAPGRAGHYDRITTHTSQHAKVCKLPVDLAQIDELLHKERVGFSLDDSGTYR